MFERPILFSAPMVRALLSGTKTQTRRVVKRTSGGGQAVYSDPVWAVRPTTAPRFNGHSHDFWLPAAAVPYSALPRCPYGAPGDRLWVREAWKAHTTFDHLPPRDIPQSHVWYMADDGYKAESRYRQGMFMPRWASRITLEVTEVRVERLQDISNADSLAEGIVRLPDGGCGLADGSHYHATYPRQSYLGLFEAINGPGSVEANPWVWVVGFKRVGVTNG